MKTQPQLQQPLNNNTLYQGLSILLVGLMLSCSVLYVSGVFNGITDFANSLIPRFVNNGNFKDITDYSSTFEIFNSQPRISYNSNSKLIFVENSDMNCINCANFHGNGATDNDYSYARFQNDFVKKGKIDYLFIDSLVFDSVEKHNSAYCVAEQNIGGFFEYKEKIYKNYSKTFNLDTAKGYASNLRLDLSKFDECYNSRKYKTRTEDLSSVTQNIFGTTSTPTFHVFYVQDKEVIKEDGSKVIEKEYTKVKTFTGNVDYDLFIKPELERLLDTYK